MSTEEKSTSSTFQSDESMTFQGGSSDVDKLIQPGASSGQEGGQPSTIAEEIQRVAEEFADRQGGSDDGSSILGESKETDKNAARRIRLEEIERGIKAAAAEELVQQKFTKTTTESKSEAAYSMGSRQQYVSQKSNGGSGIMGSLGIGQTGMWRCFNQDQNGNKEDDDSPIVIPKYNLDDIIKEESTYEGSSSKTSSLIASLTAIVEKHKISSSTVNIGKRTSTEKSETIEKLRVTLKRYRNTKVSELVTHSDFDQILSMAARYEELTFASVSYISRLSMYKSMIKERTKASQRVQLAQQRSTLFEEIAMEKQKRVNAELESVKVYAQKGDALYVKIFALKKAILKLEAEKKEVEMTFQKIVANLSIVIEEASKAYEEHHLSVRKWKEEKTSLEFSYEAIDKADDVWVSFLRTL
ncbi:unnamed protein product [Arabis nemorensis]|uniref:DNA mismatch repair protein MutS connector domain-containing protein n=1 Tax=Arabis nemorensis TaxID=586526 RepID=A0A565B7X7_9BRAS|nr:unnamed protein product [Arabis nemorensis]